MDLFKMDFTRALNCTDTFSKEEADASLLYFWVAVKLIRMEDFLHLLATEIPNCPADYAAVQPALLNRSQYKRITEDDRQAYFQLFLAIRARPAEGQSLKHKIDSFMRAMVVFNSEDNISFEMRNFPGIDMPFKPSRL